MEHIQGMQAFDDNTKEVLMLSVLTIGLAGIVAIGGLALFLKNEKPILKWGGLFAFGIGLFSVCAAYGLFQFR